MKTRRSFLAKCAFFVAGCAFSMGVERRAIRGWIPNPAYESAEYDMVFFRELNGDKIIIHREPVVLSIFTCQKMQKAASVERVHPEPKDVVPA